MIYNPLVSIDDYLKSDSVGLILELVPNPTRCLSSGILNTTPVARVLLVGS